MSLIDIERPEYPYIILESHPKEKEVMKSLFLIHAINNELVTIVIFYYLFV